MKSRSLLFAALAAFLFTTSAIHAYAATSYSISVAVTGLTGTLVVQDSKGQTLTFTTNATQTFSETFTSGSSYTVKVKTQPTGQTCTLSSNSTGTITSNITVTATCTTTSSNYSISVVTTGLTGTLVVQDNIGPTLTFTSNTTQTFSNTYASGSTYSVTVETQPAGQTCTLSSNASGTITSNITVTATCTTTSSNYTISVAVTGLTSGTLVVHDNKNDTLDFTTNGTQTFPTTYASGATYTVTIKTQPAGQTCTLSSNASGTITSDITVTATCAKTVYYKISVAVTGLTGTLVVEDSKGDTLTFTTNNTQTFAHTYPGGNTYTVTIETQPAGETCTLSSNSSGTIESNITVTATCVSNATYSISVAVTGLSGTLVVQDNTGAALTFTTNSTQTFSNTYTSGSTYSVTVQTQPAGQTCTLSSNSSGTITSNITVTATCVANATYTISVAVTGLTGTLVVQDNIGAALTFTTNNTQTFSNTYTSGSTYSVSVQTQPAGQTCTLSSNASGTITSNITVTATCAATTYSLSVSVSGLSGTVVMQDDQGQTLTFSSNNTQTFSNTYANGATYTVSVTSQPTDEACIPTYSTATINSNTTIMATCDTGATRAMGTVSDATSIACQGTLKNGVCQQVTVSCPGLPDIYAYVKTNTPTGASLGTVTYSTGTNGVSLYDSVFTYGSTAVQNVLNAGYTTVQISWGSPFNTTQVNGWVDGPGGVLESACRIATLNQWIYSSIQNNTSLPYCATGNSGGAGALAYSLSQYSSANILSMAEITSGPPTARLDWGCGCTEGKLAVQCGSAPTLGTCFGKTDGSIWDPAYNPNSPTDEGICTDAVAGTLPPGGLNFFLGDSAEAPGAVYDFPSTNINLVFGSLDNSAGIPIGQDWFNNITTTKSQVCLSGGEHSIADTLAGAEQIANDLISLCKIQ
ncbi:MAG: beta strand repeat-containing protein [Candidatus Sulfotelmatobacter sp.]